MHLFFDLDGTLTDPNEGITTCIKHALDALGHPIPTVEALEACIGPPLHQSFVELLGSTELADQALALYRERFGRVGLYENRVFDGIPASLAKLASLVDTMCVVTAKPTVYSERIVEHFGLNPYFKKVYGSHLDGRLTDKSELIASVLAQETLAPEEVIMIGDRRYDIVGAKNNGLAAIGVLWGYGSQAELEGAGATVFCHHPRELHACVFGEGVNGHD